MHKHDEWAMRSQYENATWCNLSGRVSTKFRITTLHGERKEEEGEI